MFQNMASITTFQGALPHSGVCPHILGRLIVIIFDIFHTAYCNRCIHIQKKSLVHSPGRSCLDFFQGAPSDQYASLSKLDIIKSKHAFKLLDNVPSKGCKIFTTFLYQNTTELQQLHAPSMPICSCSFPSV